MCLNNEILRFKRYDLFNSASIRPVFGSSKYDALSLGEGRIWRRETKVYSEATKPVS